MDLKHTIFLIIILLSIFGCGEDSLFTDELTVQPRIEFRLAPGNQRALEEYEITKIELTASAPDIDESLLFEITDINNEERSAVDSIDVPESSNMTFYATAFQGDKPILSSLEENVDITQEHTIIIELSPIQPIVIGMRPEQAQLNVGETHPLEIYIEHASKLSAFNCELEFDEDLLKPVEVIPGEFFGGEGDILYIEDSQFPRRQKGRLSLGITRKAGTGGAFGSDSIFRITFMAVDTGDTTIRLLRNELLRLTTSTFEQIEDPSRVVVKAEVVVEIR
jgi:hypothetical protein